MDSSNVEFRFSGAPAKVERFFIKLAEMEIPFEVNLDSGTFRMHSKDFIMMEALASILLISISAVD